MENRTKIENALNRLKGQVVRYNNEQYVLRSFDMDDERERVFIHFDNRASLDRPYDTAMVLIGMLELVPNTLISPSSNTNQAIPPPATKPRVVVPLTSHQQQCLDILGNNEIIDTAVMIVKNSLAKYEDGTINLEQAASLNDSIKSLIELEKTKVAKSAIAFKILGID